MHAKGNACSPARWHVADTDAATACLPLFSIVFGGRLIHTNPRSNRRAPATSSINGSERNFFHGIMREREIRISPLKYCAGEPTYSSGWLAREALDRVYIQIEEKKLNSMCATCDACNPTCTIHTRLGVESGAHAAANAHQTVCGYELVHQHQHRHVQLGYCHPFHFIYIKSLRLSRCVAIVVASAFSVN